MWRLDRSARSLPELIEVVTALEERGVGLRSLHEPLDTTSPGGMLVFRLFVALAEFERDLTRERTHALMPALSTAVRAVARAVVAVVLAVGIWVFVYAIAYEGAWGQFVLLVALPVVVLALLFYELSGRWRPHAHGEQEPEHVARMVARAVLALLVAGGTWAGVYAYAVDLSHNSLVGAAIVLVGPPVVILASLLYLKLLRRHRG